jgi:spore germination protein Q
LPSGLLEENGSIPLQIRYGFSARKAIVRVLGMINEMLDAIKRIASLLQPVKIARKYMEFIKLKYGEDEMTMMYRKQHIAPYPMMNMSPMMNGMPMPNGIPMPNGVPMPSGSMIPGPVAATTATLAYEESYIENILRLNLGKMATIYMTYENNSEWNAKVFKGRIEAAGRDHIIISDPQTGMRYLLLMVNLDYITFDEPLNYMYPGVGPIGMSAG